MIVEATQRDVERAIAQLERDDEDEPPRYYQ